MPGKPCDNQPAQPASTSPAQGGEPDQIDEAAMESFPASDPPTFTGTTASPCQESNQSDRPAQEDEENPK